jgi:peptide/nickel transport system ATP-binding protein
MLEVENLAISFTHYTALLSRGYLRPVRALDLSLDAGEILAVVGASGAGKSLLAHAILGLLPLNARVSGTVRFCGEPLSASRIAKLRGREIALIPQAVSYLNPLWRVGGQVRRAARLTGQGTASAATTTRTAFQRYGLEARVEHLFPFQLSGGMSKRVLTAAATVGAAKLLIADEPTAGLDHGNRDRMLAYLRQMSDGGRAILLITHDLTAALQVADKITVFQGGMTVETAPRTMFGRGRQPRHPYTRQLFDALPENGFTASVNGKNGAANEDDQKQGCGFHPHCPEALAACLRSVPPKRKTDSGWVRCHAV